MGVPSASIPGASRAPRWLLGLLIAGLLSDVLPAARSLAAAEPRRPGKVVRVERPQLIKRSPIMICPMPYAEKQGGVCYGTAPAVGSSAVMFDFDQNYLGRFRVTSVTRGQTDTCGSGSAFDFSYEYIHKVDGFDQRSVLFAIAAFGLEIDARKAKIIPDGTHLPNPAGDRRMQPWMGMDRDGDGMPDLVVTAFECTELAPPPPSGITGLHKLTYCLDYWLDDDRGGFRRLRRDHVYACQ